MKRTLIGVILGALSTWPAVADATVPGTPVTVSASTNGNGDMTLLIPAPSAPNMHFYLTDFSVTGTGATTPSLVLITYYGMSGSTTSNESYDVIVPPAPGQQVNFHRAYTYPWQATASGNMVQIVVRAFGAGNYGAAARVVGFYQ